MPSYKYNLEASTTQLAFDNSKRNTVETCPFCGKSNKDGKFVPYAGFKDRGHCFSCGRYSPIGEHTCPACKAQKAFNKYLDTSKNEYIDNSVGKCLFCGYHYSPKQYFEDQAIANAPNRQKQIKTSSWHCKSIHAKPILVNQTTSYIPVDIFKASLKSHAENNFVRYLISLFGAEITNQLISRYFIATSKHWSGANVFWQIDSSGKVRAGKIMLYNSENGKRIKEPVSRVDWVHSVMKYPDFKLRQCFFGEHLLADKTRPVAIVESEKTAIIASVYLPQFIWLSAGGKEGLNHEKCKVLAGRTVTLFPDLNAFDSWSTKAKELSHLAHITVSGLLQNNATPSERQQGLDLADYLIKFDYKLFIKQTTDPVEAYALDIEPPQTSALVNNFPALQIPFKDKSVDIRQYYLDELNKSKKSIYNKQSGSWDNEIQSLESFFNSIQLPDPPLRLNQCTVILNLPGFISSHIETLRFYNGNPVFLPCLKRLQLLQNIINSNIKQQIQKTSTIYRPSPFEGEG